MDRNDAHGIFKLQIEGSAEQHPKSAYNRIKPSIEPTSFHLSISSREIAIFRRSLSHDNGCMPFVPTTASLGGYGNLMMSMLDTVKGPMTTMIFVMILDFGGSRERKNDFDLFVPFLPSALRDF